MPRKPPTPCRWPGCPERASGAYCEQHKQRQEQLRGSSTERGYDAQWRRARKRFLAMYPLCAECGRNGTITPATVVDHKTPHRGDRTLFWEEKNWQPLCKPCHDRKTALEDGGFGNTPKLTATSHLST